MARLELSRPASNNVDTRLDWITRSLRRVEEASSYWVNTGLVYANLPAVPATGMVAVITDSSTATWGATIAGGGANTVLAWYNGTDWTVIGA